MRPASRKPDNTQEQQFIGIGIIILKHTYIQKKKPNSDTARRVLKRTVHTE